MYVYLSFLQIIIAKIINQNIAYFLRVIEGVMRQCMPGRYMKRLKIYCKTLTKFCPTPFPRIKLMDCHDHCIRLILPSGI